MEVAVNTTASTAITGAAVNYIEMDGGGGQPGVAIGVVPAMSALAAAETVTVSIIRLDTGAVIGSSVFTNSGAGASTGGPVVVVAPIPAGMAGGIALAITGSVATGNVLGSATAPITLTRLP
jgi:hypothetical protein